MTVLSVMRDILELVLLFALKSLPLDVKITVLALMSVLNVQLDLIYNQPPFVLSVLLPSPLMENAMVMENALPLLEVMMVMMMVMMEMMITMVMMVTMVMMTPQQFWESLSFYPWLLLF